MKRVFQDYLSHRLCPKTDDDGDGQEREALQEQLPLLQDDGGHGGIPGFLQRLVGEPHQGDGHLYAAGSVRRGPSSYGGWATR